MDKTLKSLVGSLVVLFIYLYATEGIVRLFCKDTKRRPFYTLLTAVMLVIVSLFLIIIPFHTCQPDNVTILYKSIIYFYFIYLLTGSTVNFLIKH